MGTFAVTLDVLLAPSGGVALPHSIRGPEGLCLPHKRQKITSVRQPFKHNPGLQQADANKESKCSYDRVLASHFAPSAALLGCQYAGRYNQGVDAGAQSTQRPSTPMTHGSFSHTLSNQSALTVRG